MGVSHASLQCMYNHLFTISSDDLHLYLTSYIIFIFLFLNALSSWTTLIDYHLQTACQPFWYYMYFIWSLVSCKCLFFQHNIIKKKKNLFLKLINSILFYKMLHYSWNEVRISFTEIIHVYIICLFFLNRKMKEYITCFLFFIKLIYV